MAHINPSELVASILDQYDIKSEVIDCDPELADTAVFCERYGFKLEESANTILVTSKKVDPPKYAACLVLASMRLDVNKKVTSLLHVKKVSFADSKTTIKLTGMMIGGVTVVGIKELPIYIDSAVMKQQMVVLGGGDRSHKIIVNPKELLKLPGVQVIEGLAKSTL